MSVLTYIGMIFADLILFMAIILMFHAFSETSFSKEQNWIDRCEQLVRAQLKDADSARFRQVFFNHATKMKFPIACGQVNAKNSFGDYAGYEGFICGGTDQTTWLEENIADFPHAWETFCK